MKMYTDLVTAVSAQFHPPAEALFDGDLITAWPLSKPV